MSRPLTKKQEGFASDYSLHGDASKAYRDNYDCKKSSAKTINEHASKLLKHAKVAPRVKELQEKVAEIAEKEFSYTAADMLGKLLGDIAADVNDLFNEAGQLKPMEDWPLAFRTGLATIEIEQTTVPGMDQIGTSVKVKVPERSKRLELMGKHVSVQAFKDQIKNETSTLEDALKQIAENDGAG